MISGAALNPPKKVWTAFIGLGPGWKNKRESVAQIVHTHFHKIPPSRINIKGNDFFWDFPDVLLFPGVIFKKHDCSSEPGLIDHWPVYFLMPSAINDPVYGLRPLAAARGYVLLLYSAVGLFLGKGNPPNLQDIANNTLLSVAIFVTILGFSFTVFLIDLAYVRKKLRVVVARDERI